MLITVNGISASGGAFQDGIIYLQSGTTNPGGMQVDVMQTFRPTQICQ